MKTKQKIIHPEVPRAALYTRVSTEEQAKTGFSLAAQEERCRNFAAGKGWEIVDVYCDDGHSAKDLNRPQIERLISDAKRRRFDNVVFLRLDRLSRDIGDMTMLRKLFTGLAIGMVSLSEDFDTSTSSGRLAINMHGSIAQYEREVTADRVRMGLERSWSEGHWHGGEAPFGYDYDKEKKRLVINSSEAGVVRLIYRLAIEAAIGARFITRHLNGTGVLRRGRLWSLNSVLYILRNPLYCGYLQSRSDPPQQIKGLHDPVIAVATFERAQRVLDSRKALSGQVALSPNLFSGLSFCGECGSRLHLSRTAKKTSTKPGGGYRYYFCSGKREGGPQTCRLPYANGEIFDQQVIDAIFNAVTDRENLRKYVSEFISAQTSESVGLKERVVEIVAEKRRIGDQVAQFSDILVEECDPETSQLYRNHIKELLQQKSELEREHRALQAKFGESHNRLADENQVLALTENLRELFYRADDNVRRLLLRSILDRVTVFYDKSVEVQLKIPLSAGVSGDSSGNGGVKVGPPGVEPGTSGL